MSSSVNNMRRRQRLGAWSLTVACALASFGAQAREPQRLMPQTAQRVTFPSLDGKTTLTGYLFVPPDHAGRVPAVVMMHGRAGAYSTRAHGVYDATTLSRRHQAWGKLWASLGYV